MQENDYEHSDGPSPEAKVKQILAVAPILAGQKVAAVDGVNGGSFTQNHALQEPADSGDLLDFGTLSAPALAPNGQSSTTNHELSPEVGNAPPGLQQPLQPTQPIKRIDTQEGSIDEFVDAKPT